MAYALAKHALVLLLGAILYLLTGPRLVWHPEDTLADPRDAVLNTWIMAWDAHALDTSPASIWNAPQFYPARDTLGYSETMFGTLWYSYPINHFTENPVLAANAHIFISFILCMYAVFLLVRDLTGDYLAGVVAGALFSYCPYRWGQLVHMQLLPFYYAPIAMLFLFRFLRTEQPRYFYCMVAAQSAQYYMSMNLGTLSLTMLLIIGAAFFLTNPDGKSRFIHLFRPGMRQVFLLGGLLAAVLLLPLTYKYFQVMHTWDLQRSESENICYSCELLAFLNPHVSHAYASCRPTMFVEHVRGSAWIGLTPMALAIAACVAVRERHGYAPEQARLVRICSITAIACGIFMLGPKFIWLDEPTGIPLPYYFVFYGVPGGRGMRTPCRFFLPLLLCVSVLAGFFAAHVRRSGMLRHPPVLLLIAFGSLVWLKYDCAIAERTTHHAPSPAEFPAVYRFLAQAPPDAPILELPIAAYEQFDYLFFQTAHWRPLVNGYSGYLTPGVIDLCDRPIVSPSPEALDRIALTPAQFVVIHLDRFGPDRADEWRQADLATRDFRRVGQFDQSVVWERIGRVEPASATLQLTEPKMTHRLLTFTTRFTLTLNVSAAETGKPWRFLHTNHTTATVTIDSERGRRSFDRTVHLPPYLRVEEMGSIKIEPLDVREGERCRIRIECEAFAPFEVELTP